MISHLFLNLYYIDKQAVKVFIRYLHFYQTSIVKKRLPVKSLKRSYFCTFKTDPTNMLKNFKSLIIVSLLALLTSCSPHWDSYSASNSAKGGRAENANGKSGRRKAVKKPHAYSSGGGYYAKKNTGFKDSYSRNSKASRGMNWSDSYSKKTKNKYSRKFSHDKKNHKKRGRMFKPKRRVVKRKGSSR